MAKCTKILRKKRQVCIGQLNEQIILQARAIQPPSGSSVDYGEDFSGDNTVWALVETVRGETVFDSTNTEQDITHRFYIRHISGITGETWIEYNSAKLDIVDVENLDERSGFLLLRANNRGDKAVEVNLS